MRDEEIQERLKTVFRQGELQRREARRKVMINHVNLEGEEAAPIDKMLAERLKKQSLAFEKEFSPGYWQRLWAAIRGK